MNILRKTVLPVLLASIWIGISEFTRNEFILKDYWVEHYESLGMVFPSEPVNGGVWGVWSLFLAIVIYILAKKFSLLHTTFLSWFVAFVLMWLVVGNLGVLPFRMLLYAIPLSLLEAYVAGLIIVNLSGRDT